MCLPLRNGWFPKERVIIDIIYDKNPFPDLPILQPVPEELENIGVGILAPGNLSTASKVAQTFLVARGITRVNPENPGVGRMLPDSVAVFDGESRFSFGKVSLVQTRAGLTSPNPPQANETYPRSRDRGSFVDLIEEFIAANKIWIMRERYGRQWFRARFWLV